MSDVRMGFYGVSFERTGRRILDEVSFELSKGEILALAGPNGSGKSTLLKLASGLQDGASGTIRVEGVDQRELSQSERARKIVYVPAELKAEFPLTAEEMVSLGRLCHPSRASEKDAELVRTAMERAFCWELRARDWHTLSGGERQLVALARALAQGAKTLLLDEALSKMDLHHQARVGILLRELARDGIAIVLVSHDLNLASEWSETLLMLEAGKRRACGPIGATLTAELVRSIYPGASLRVDPSPATGKPKIHFGSNQK